RGISFPSHLD
ncbi:NAD dependent epimerase/dehydratase family protein, partial [Vibrio harveyi]